MFVSSDAAPGVDTCLPAFTFSSPLFVQKYPQWRRVHKLTCQPEFLLISQEWIYCILYHRQKLILYQGSWGMPLCTTFYYLCKNNMSFPTLRCFCRNIFTSRAVAVKCLTTAQQRKQPEAVGAADLCRTVCWNINSHISTRNSITVFTLAF